MTKHSEIIVVGSGCSGAMAAQTLIEAGHRVTMVDVGNHAPSSIKVPNGTYLDLRQHDENQYKYLIGENFEGVGWGKVGKAEQVTPPRKHIMKDVDTYAPIDSSTFSPLESLGYGGLGIGWGLQCWEYSESDLQKTGLNKAAMSDAYSIVARRIGISATKDDAARYTIGDLTTYQASAHIDRNHKHIMKKYNAKHDWFNKQGFYMGRTPLALSTEKQGTRKAYGYQDMDFYSDNDQSAWRPWITVNQLRKHPNFTYYSSLYALSFEERDKQTQLTCLNTETNEKVILTCKRLVLATSALGSARIVLRSLGAPSTRLPLLCNPYTYIPSIQPRQLGKAAEKEKLGFTQLSMFFDPEQNNTNTSVASIYSYQSLMLFRLIRHVPLDFADARRIMQYLQSGIVIMGIHHPDSVSSEKFVQLKSANDTITKDILHVQYALSDAEKHIYEQREKAFIQALRKTGTYALKKMNPGYGSSIHYAGTLPFSDQEKPFTLARSGRLHGTTSVYVADSSGFKYLPAPGLTYSLMANAHNVARAVSDEF